MIYINKLPILVIKSGQKKNLNMLCTAISDTNTFRFCLPSAVTILYSKISFANDLIGQVRAFPTNPLNMNSQKHQLFFTQILLILQFNMLLNFPGTAISRNIIPFYRIV